MLLGIALGLLSLAVILVPGNFMIIRCLVSRYAVLHIETSIYNSELGNSLFAAQIASG